MGAGAKTSLAEIASLFLRLGATAFGGPAAHIAMMHDEVVTRRKWLGAERFLDLLGATQLIPGPNSTELALFVGWERRRAIGLVVAGLSFMLPATLITCALAVIYVRFGSLPALSGLLYGVKPVILGVVLQAIWSLVPMAARTPAFKALAIVAALLAALGVNEIAVLFGAGALAMLSARAERGSNETRALGLVMLPAASGAAAASVSLPSLFWVFFKTGSLLFGSGYVLLAFLRADLVVRLGWLDEARLLDAVAVGQVTPGPVSSTATFIGYLLGGTGGAAVATAGIFLPAFIFVALSGPLLPRLRSSPRAGAFLDGVNAASLALMAVVTVQLARAAVVDVPTACLGIVSGLLLVRFKINSSWLVLGGAAVGLIVAATTR